MKKNNKGKNIEVLEFDSSDNKILDGNEVLGKTNNNFKLNKKGIIIVVFVLFIITSTILTYFFLLNKPKTISIDENLAKINNHFNNLAIIGEMKNRGEIITTVTFDRFDFTYTLNETNEVFKCSIIVDDNYLVSSVDISSEENKSICEVFTFSAFDALGIEVGIDEGVIFDLIYAYSENLDFMEVVENDNIKTYKLNTDIPILAPSNREQHIYTDDILNSSFDIDKLLSEGSMSVTLDKEVILAHLVSTDDEINIYFLESVDSAGLTYKSILSFVEALFPDDYNQFQSEFLELESITIDRFKVLTNLRESYLDSLTEDYNLVIEDKNVVVLQIDKD